MLVSLNSHGGENFVKFRGKTVVLSEELNRALKESSIKRRFKEMLFIVDTCEGLSLWDHVNVDNIYFVSSSKKDQKASSTDYNWDMMTPLSDKFHNLFFKKMKEIHVSKKFDLDLIDLFVQMQNEKNYIDSDVSMVDTLGKKIKFMDYFGNPLNKNKEIEIIIKDDIKSLQFEKDLFIFIKEKRGISKLNHELFGSNKNYMDNFHKIENELSNLNKYKESNLFMVEENINDYNYKNYFIVKKLSERIDEFKLIYSEKFITLMIFFICCLFLLIKK